MISHVLNLVCIFKKRQINPDPFGLIYGLCLLLSCTLALMIIIGLLLLLITG
ncbi:hypothetical protein [Shewanella atlantica]|uniref:hypothetical protein n=1 Tax=Shewanella atlantica TaxID=271099 RepID=UPI001639C798|nr:hypothetical protein [Shewanella atlantica]